METDDLCAQQDLTEERLLEILAARYFAGQIYTNSGLFLISINPLQRTDLLSEAAAAVYRRASLQDTRPHIFSLLNECLADSAVRGQQAILITGDSGSGKTETARHILRYLGIEEAEDANVLLEGFGNASTPLNANSSRFGKLIQLDGRVSIEALLLERSRVTSASFGQNFHVFYAVLAGLGLSFSNSYIRFDGTKCNSSRCRCCSAAEKNGCDDTRNTNTNKEVTIRKRREEENAADPEKMSGKGSVEMLERITKKTDTCKKKSMEKSTGAAKTAGTRNEAENPNSAHDTRRCPHLGMYESLVAAARAVGIDWQATERILLGILRLGNLYSVNGVLEPSGEVDGVGADIGLSAGALEAALTRHTLTIAGEKITKIYTPQDSAMRRDALARQLYSALFRHVLTKINQFLALRPISVTKISILDLFGFENFVPETRQGSLAQLSSNGLDQFCINWCNERIYENFMAQSLCRSKKLLEEEGVSDSKLGVEMPPSRLAAIEGRCGVADLVGEEALLGGSAESLAAKLKSCPGLRMLPRNRMEYEHYAGHVIYELEDFVKKSREKCSLCDIYMSNNRELDRRSKRPGGGAVHETGYGNVWGWPSSGKGSGEVAISGTGQTGLDLTGIKADSGDLEATGGSDVQQRELPSSSSHTHFIRDEVLCHAPSNTANLIAAFRQDMEALFGRLSSAHIRHVRCIRPNRQNTPGCFDKSLVATQLRSSGVLPALEMSRVLFAHWLFADIFLERYRCLVRCEAENKKKDGSRHSLSSADDGSLVEEVHQFLEHLKGARCRSFPSFRPIFEPAGSVAIGRTRVFFSNAVFRVLERERLLVHSEQLFYTLFLSVLTKARISEALRLADQKKEDSHSALADTENEVVAMAMRCGITSLNEKMGGVDVNAVEEQEKAIEAPLCGRLSGKKDKSQAKKPADFVLTLQQENNYKRPNDSLVGVSQRGEEDGSGEKKYVRSSRAEDNRKLKEAKKMRRRSQARIDGEDGLEESDYYERVVSIGEKENRAGECVEGHSAELDLATSRCRGCEVLARKYQIQSQRLQRAQAAEEELAACRARLRAYETAAKESSDERVENLSVSNIFGCLIQLYLDYAPGLSSQDIPRDEMLSLAHALLFVLSVLDEDSYAENVIACVDEVAKRLAAFERSAPKVAFVLANIVEVRVCLKKRKDKVRKAEKNAAKDSTKHEPEIRAGDRHTKAEGSEMRSFFDFVSVFSGLKDDDDGGKKGASSSEIPKEIKNTGNRLSKEDKEAEEKDGAVSSRNKEGSYGRENEDLSDSERDEGDEHAVKGLSDTPSFSPVLHSHTRQAALTDAIEQLDLLISTLFNHLCVLLRGSLDDLIPASLLEHQPLKSFRVKESIYRRIFSVPSISRYTSALSCAYSLLTYFCLPDVFVINSLSYLLSYTDFISFNALVSKKNFLSFNRCMQINSNLNEIEKFCREVGFGEGVYNIAYTREAVRVSLSSLQGVEHEDSFLSAAQRAALGAGGIARGPLFIDEPCPVVPSVRGLYSTMRFVQPKFLPGKSVRNLMRIIESTR